MPDDPGSEPITDDELLYRRIPVSKKWYDHGTLSPESFDPRPDDVTGLSFSRAKYKTVAEAGQGASKHGYLVAVCNAKAIRANGMTCVPKPEPGDPGHCEIPEIRADNRETNETLERKYCLSQLFKHEVHGPFVNPQT